MKKLTTLLLVFLAVVCSLPAKAAGDLYILGNLSGGWDLSDPSHKMDYDETNGEYTHTLNITGGNKYVVFSTKLGSSASDWSGIDRYCTGSDVTVSKTGSYSIWGGQSNGAFKLADGDWTITVNAALSTANFKLESGSTVVTPLYVIGNVGALGVSWAADNGVKMDGGEDGVYTISFEAKDVCELGFATKLGTNDSDWSTLNANRYAPKGHTGDDRTEVSAADFGKEFEMEKATESAWKLTEAGKYTVTVDMNAMTVKFDCEMAEANVYTFKFLDRTGWDWADKDLAVQMFSNRDGQWIGSALKECTSEEVVETEGGKLYTYSITVPEMEAPYVRILRGDQPSNCIVRPYEEGAVYTQIEADVERTIYYYGGKFGWANGYPLKYENGLYTLVTSFGSNSDQMYFRIATKESNYGKENVLNYGNIGSGNQELPLNDFENVRFNGLVNAGDNAYYLDSASASNKSYTIRVKFDSETTGSIAVLEFVDHEPSTPIAKAVSQLEENGKKKFGIDLKINWKDENKEDALNGRSVKDLIGNYLICVDEAVAKSLNQAVNPGLTFAEEQKLVLKDGKNQQVHGYWAVLPAAEYTEAIWGDGVTFEWNEIDPTLDYGFDVYVMPGEGLCAFSSWQALEYKRAIKVENKLEIPALKVTLGVPELEVVDYEYENPAHSGAAYTYDRVNTFKASFEVENNVVLGEGWTVAYTAKIGDAEPLAADANGMLENINPDAENTAVAVTATYTRGEGENAITATAVTAEGAVAFSPVFGKIEANDTPVVAIFTGDSYHFNGNSQIMAPKSVVYDAAVEQSFTGNDESYAGYVGYKVITTRDDKHQGHIRDIHKGLYGGEPLEGSYDGGGNSVEGFGSAVASWAAEAYKTGKMKLHIHHIACAVDGGSEEWNQPEKAEDVNIKVALEVVYPVLVNPVFVSADAPEAARARAAAREAGSIEIANPAPISEMNLAELPSADVNETSYTTTGVEDVAVDVDGVVEYFNLQGVRVENPETGLYIRRQAGRTEKVYIR